MGASTQVMVSALERATNTVFFCISCREWKSSRRRWMDVTVISSCGAGARAAADIAVTALCQIATY